MFTGLIEDIGVIANVKPLNGGSVVSIDTSLPLDKVSIGDSIAVNGACLTVIAIRGRIFEADASPETMERTTLGHSQKGTYVNLERALCFGDPLGGHLVTGHIDSLARLVSRYRKGNMDVLRFEPDPAALPMMVEKGSVAVDGISLTINEVGDDFFSVGIIPHTLQETTLASRGNGDVVNIETDLIGKYVARLMGINRSDEKKSKLDVDFLARHGFV